MHTFNYTYKNERGHFVSTKLESLNHLQLFLKGVIDRADHHAKEVEGVALAVAGGLLAYSDKLEDIKLRTNILWTSINKQTLVFAYNHSKRTIEIRNRSQRGDVLASFQDATTTLEDVLQFFKSLEPKE